MSDFWLEFAFFHGEALLVCRVFVFRSELHPYGLDECVCGGGGGQGGLYETVRQRQRDRKSYFFEEIRRRKYY